MKMDNYITLQRKNKDTLLLHCDFGGGTYMHFQIDEWDIDTEFPYYTAHVVDDSFAYLEFPLSLWWDRDILEEKRLDTLYYDFYATTLQDMVHELAEAYEQYLIELEAI